jgi:hypothetical protein
MKWLVFFIVIVSLMLLLSRRTVSEMKFETSSKVPGKTIWILWLQGWDDAPELIKEIKESWVRHNPGWNVELVSEANLSNYIDVYLPPDASSAAKSDIIRLNLLYAHGGVWADATLLCMSPLDVWVYDALEPEGFWMYHNGEDRPCSWFIISMKSNYIITKWKEACDEYWRDKKEADYYFWMDSLFMNILQSDEKFRSIWNNVPYLDCEAVGESHMLATKWFETNTINRTILDTNPPYVIKLTRHNGYPDKNTDMYYALKSTIKSDIHQMIHKEKLQIFKNKVAIFADCGNEVELHELKQICDEYNIQMIVYDKCEFGKFIPSDIYARPLKNVGRDAGTFIYFVISNWDNLPSEIYLIPSTIYKHNRKDRFLKMLEDPSYIGYTTPLNEQENFTIDEWDGKSLVPSNTRPFKKWFERYIGVWDHHKNSNVPVWNCTMKTTGKKIRKHSLDYFKNIHSQLVEDNNLEAVHYVERSMNVIF